MTDAPGPPSPRANTLLQGHPEAQHIMAEAVEAGRLHHAWLICGPRGIGKATLAYEFARYLLATPSAATPPPAPSLFGDALPTDDPSRRAQLSEQGAKNPLAVPEDHPAVRRITAGGHADLLVVERQTDSKTGKRRAEIVVDDVRGVGRFLSKTPAEGGWRVVIIDAADEMNRNAANAVLKVLEEPPKQAVLLLVTHNPGRLLPTILSRCRRLVLRAPSPDICAAIIRRYHPATSEADARLLARLAECSPGRALELLGEGGLEFYAQVLTLLASLPQLDGPALHKLANGLARPGAEAGYVVVSELLRGWLSRLVLAGSRHQPLPDEETALAERLLAAVPLDRWITVWENTEHLFARAGGGGNLDRKQVVLNAFLALEGGMRQAGAGSSSRDS